MRDPDRFRLAVVGLGLMGRQRVEAAEALRQEGLGTRLVAVYDTDPARRDICQLTDAPLARSVGELVARTPDLVVVALPHDEAVDVVEEVLTAGADVLVEKPLGRNLGEAQFLRDVAHATGRRLFVGLNYRFMPGITALLRDIGDGWFGSLVSIELTLGHGGAPGDEHTWKLDPLRAGGGCLLDPGIHLLDLAGLLGGDDLRVLAGATWSGHWRTGIEEECHVLLAGSSVPIVNLAVSIVRWRSTFTLRVNGDAGYGLVTGRGRSCGPQRYTRGRRWGWRQASSQVASEELVFHAEVDLSFHEELRAVVTGSTGGPRGVATADEAVATMALLEACRRAVQTVEA